MTAVRGGLAELIGRAPLTGCGPDGGLPPLPKSAWIEIDLDALRANYHTLREGLPAGMRLDPVVKGDAYGHGAVAVARAVEAAGASNLAVATFDEALELREAGVATGILILYPIPPELGPAALRHGFAVTGSDVTLLGRLLDALAAAPGEAGRGPHGAGPAASPDERLAIHLEVETGLGRAGLLPAQVPAAIEAIAASPRARLAGLWSHLQAAGNRDLAAGQDRAFEAASALLEQASIRLPARHLAASGGVLAASVGEYDAVRIGLSLYGLVPDGLRVEGRFASVAGRLRPVLALRARPIRVAELPRGTGVSYGPSFVTARDSRIATLPVGYADGYPRSLSNRSQVLVRGRRVPSVGTVAMDAIMVDVTDVPGEPVTVDDEFTLIGGQGDERIDAAEVARWGNTISYEVVTAMSRRLPRVYYAAAEAVGLRTLASEGGGWLRAAGT